MRNVRRHALLLLVLAASCGLLGYATASGLLLVVGDVTPHTARILYDWMPSDEGSTHAPARLEVRVMVHRYDASASSKPTGMQELQQEMDIDLQMHREDPGHDHDRARVLELRELTSNHAYTVLLSFHAAFGSTTSTSTGTGTGTGTDTGITTDVIADGQVRFRTATSDGDDNDGMLTAPRVLVVSCDRFVDDGDDTLWLALADDMERHEHNHVGVAHIGDQVYVDVAGAISVDVQAVPLAARHNEKARRLHFQAAVHRFRAVYRATWGRAVMQRVLRHGAHWMLPDDHDVHNNFNRALVQRLFASELKDDPAEDELAMQLHLRAALQVLYEYQYQLRQPIDWASIDFMMHSLAEIVQHRYPLHFTVEWAQFKLFFLDVRFDRSFLPHGGALLGEQQMQDLKTSLDTWRRPQPTASLSTETTAVVLTAMPLFFHSSVSAQIAYRVERELYPGHHADAAHLNQLYSLFLASATTLRLLVGGDIHALVHSRVCSGAANNESCLDQLITSGTTAGSTSIVDAKLLPFYYFITSIYPFLQTMDTYLRNIEIDVPWRFEPWRVSSERVFFGRNYGVLEFSVSGRRELEWRRSVTIPHGSVKQRATQWLLDCLHPVALLLLLVLPWLLVPRWLQNATCLPRRAQRRKPHEA